MGDDGKAEETRANTHGRKATLRDVAARAGVSAATASYVMSGRQNRTNPATPETQERVRAAAAALSYRANRAGRNLRRGRSDLVAFVLTPPITPWDQELLRQADEIGARRGYGSIVLPLHATQQSRSTVEGLLDDGLADAVVIGSPRDFGQQGLRRVARQGRPIAVIDEYLSPSGFDVWGQEAEHAARDAVGYLLATGSHRIAYLGPPESRGHPHSRLIGYRRALEAAGVADDPALFAQTADSRVGMYAAALDLLSRPARQRPDAVFSSSDRGAVAVLWAARRLEIEVPDQLRVIGSGNSPEEVAVSPALTTIGPATLDFSPWIERLFDRIADPTLKPTTLVSPWQLIRRESA